MENELDVIESLKAVGYHGKCLQNDVLTEALSVGIKSEEFREVVGWVAYELHVLKKTDEKVDKDTDFSEFSMELSAMLKELGCPFKKFVAGPLSSRFQNKQARIQLLEYLITELMTTKMCLKQKPMEDDSFVIPKFETNTARALETISKDLGLGKPPDNVAPRAIFDKLNFKLDEAKRNTDKQLLADSLLRPNKQLSAAQWKKLEDIQKSLDEEYNLRRQVLLTRLEVTVQSFEWSERMRGKENIIESKYEDKIKELEECRFGGLDTDIVALLAARSDLAIIEKTSSANVRKNTGTKIQKHVIGQVPDRGGRANEHAPPPPEMPSWQTQRSAGPGRGGGFGGGRGGGDFRGGRGGRGGGGRGGGGGGGGNWQQYQSGNSNGGGGNFKADNFQSSNQGNNYQSNKGGSWLTGSGRVQGTGWQQGGSSNNLNSSNSQSSWGNFAGTLNSLSRQNSGGSNFSGGGSNFSSNFSGGGSSFGGGGSNFTRGKSNYNRGGGGGGYRNN